MADLKISQLPASTTPLTGAELLPIVQSSTTKQVSVANLTAGRAISSSSLQSTDILGTNIASFPSIVLQGGGTNLFKYSEDWTNAFWSYLVGTVTITADYATAPDLTLSADRLVFAASSRKGVQNFTIVNGTTYTFSAYVKATGTVTDLNVYWADGVVTVITPITVTTSWQRVTYTVTAGSNLALAIGFRSAGGADVAIWGMQLEASSSMGNYVKTVTTAVTTAATPSINTNSDISIPTGNIIPGTAAKGINFTANTGAAGKTSQLLNWYEEGTWTTGMTADTGTVTLSYNKLNYTRVGRMVSISGEIVVSAISSPTGDVYISLPFATAINASGRSGYWSSYLGIGYTFTGTPGGPLVGLNTGNSSTLMIRVGNNAGGSALSGYLVAGTTIDFGFTYQCQ